MPISLLQKQVIEIKMNAYCKNKIPQEFQNQIKFSYKIRRDNITLIESRPFWQDKSKWIDSKIAQIRFNNRYKTYTLYCANRNGKWLLYEPLEPCYELDEIDTDNRDIFLG